MRKMEFIGLRVYRYKVERIDHKILSKMGKKSEVGI